MARVAAANSPDAGPCLEPADQILEASSRSLPGVGRLASNSKASSSVRDDVRHRIPSNDKPKNPVKYRVISVYAAECRAHRGARAGAQARAGTRARNARARPAGTHLTHIGGCGGSASIRLDM